MSETYIILVNYNNHDDTLKCLASIAEAGYEKNVIVIDNNSTLIGVDNIKTEFPGTILIRNEENIGFGRANNIGIEWALKNTNCEYVFILNNDTLIEKDTIDILRKEINTNSEIAIAAPRIVVADNPTELWYGGGEVDWKKGAAKIPGYFGPPDTPLALKKRYVTFASGCAMLIKKSPLRQLRGFDTRYFMYCEDLELCLRITNNKWKILYVPEALVKHRCQGSQKISTKKIYPILHHHNPNLDFFLYHTTKNRLLTVKLHGSTINKTKFFIYFSLYMSYKLSSYLYYRRLSTIATFTKAIRDFIREC